jgi:hypothetical protein
MEFHGGDYPPAERNRREKRRATEHTDAHSIRAAGSPDGGRRPPLRGRSEIHKNKRRWIIPALVFGDLCFQ